MIRRMLQVALTVMVLSGVVVSIGCDEKKASSPAPSGAPDGKPSGTPPAPPPPPPPPTK